MRRSKAAVMLVAMGVLALLMAPVWRWAIGPALIKIPKDLRVTSIFLGEFKLYADRETGRLYPGGQAVSVPLSIRADVHSDESRCTTRTVVLEEDVRVKNARTGETLEGVRPEAVYVLDRRTSENVPGLIEGINRTGYTVKLPSLAKKKDYPVWDDELGGCVFAEYECTARADGDRHKGVPVYIYKTPGEMMKMARPPAGSPASLSGKKIREMTGISVPDTAEMSLEYYKKTESAWWVEPKTGMVVRVPRYHYEYYVKNGLGQSPAYLKLAEVDYSSTGANSRKDVDESARYIRKIDADLVGAPWMFFATGAILIAVSLVLVRTRLPVGALYS